MRILVLRIGLHPFIGLLQEPGTLKTRPGANRLHPIVNKTRRNQAVKGWIHPAIYRNIGCALIAWFAQLVRVIFGKGSELREIRRTVLGMSTIYLTSDVPSDGAPDERVSHKMLLPSNSRS